MHSTERPSGDPILRQIRFGFVGPYPVAGMAEPWLERLAETHRRLKQRGVGAILTLTEDDLYGRWHRQAGFICHHEPIEDQEAPSPEAMNRAVEFIDACLVRGAGVAVHCLEGRGRTGTVLSGWLGLREGLAAEAAIRRIRSLRLETVISSPQRAFLERYLEGGRPDLRVG